MRLLVKDKCETWSTRSAKVLAALVTALLCSVLAFGQKPEYEFYFDFRKDFSPTLQEKNHWSLTNEQVIWKYAAKLKSDGISDTEIAQNRIAAHGARRFRSRLLESLLP
jgi:hypothetical protein